MSPAKQPPLREVWPDSAVHCSGPTDEPSLPTGQASALFQARALPVCRFPVGPPGSASGPWDSGDRPWPTSGCLFVQSNLDAPATHLRVRGLHAPAHRPPYPAAMRRPPSATPTSAETRSAFAALRTPSTAFRTHSPHAQPRRAAPASTPCAPPSPTSARRSSSSASRAPASNPCGLAARRLAPSAPVHRPPTSATSPPAGPTRWPLP